MWDAVQNPIRKTKPLKAFNTEELNMEDFNWLMERLRRLSVGTTDLAQRSGTTAASILPPLGWWDKKRRISPECKAEVSCAYYSPDKGFPMS